MAKLTNCKDCPYTKCLLRGDKDFEICPVEKNKQELIKKDNA